MNLDYTREIAGKNHRLLPTVLLPWGAPLPKIDTVCPCTALLLLLMRSLVVAGLESFTSMPRVRLTLLRTGAATWSGGVAF